MTIFSQPKVAAFMRDIQLMSGEMNDIVLQIRDVFFSFDPNLVEDIKYGGLVFVRGSELISGIFVYKEHISIEFAQGLRLPDPHLVLEGKGKFRRHIKIRSFQELSTKNIATYIKNALELTRHP